MASLNSYQIHNFTSTTLLLILMLHRLLSPVSCFNQPQPAISPRDQLFEEKNRLGSIPPSCHNKCNECHPCMAVQVPPLPSHQGQGFQQGLTKEEGFFHQQDSRYSNYKPLGWKCHCGDHFFNP